MLLHFCYCSSKPTIPCRSLGPGLRAIKSAVRDPSPPSTVFVGSCVQFISRLCFPTKDTSTTQDEDGKCSVLRAKLRASSEAALAAEGTDSGCLLQVCDGHRDGLWPLRQESLCMLDDRAHLLFQRWAGTEHSLTGLFLIKSDAGIIAYVTHCPGCASIHQQCSSSNLWLSWPFSSAAPIVNALRFRRIDQPAFIET